MTAKSKKTENAGNQIRNLILDLDIYLAILAAIVLTVISLFDPNRVLLNSLTLSSIIVVLITQIGIRSRVDKIISDNEKYDDGAFSSVLPEDFEERLNRCSELWIIGIHQHEFFTAYHNRIRYIAQHNSAKIRILLVDPNGSASKMTALRFANVSPPVDSEREKIKTALQDLDKMRRESSCDFDIRIIDFLLPYGAILIDRHKADRSRMYIERYTFRVRGGPAKPKIEYLPSSNWYDLYDREIQELWKEGIQYDSRY